MIRLSILASYEAVLLQIRPYYGRAPRSGVQRGPHRAHGAAAARAGRSNPMPVADTVDAEPSPPG